MNLNNVPMTLESGGPMAGRKGTTVTIPAAIRVNAYDITGGGFVDYLFERVPEVQRLLCDGRTPGLRLTLKSPDVFDGSKNHRIAVWDLPASERGPEADPLFRANAVVMRGPVKMAIHRNAKDGGDYAIVRLSFYVPGGELAGIPVSDLCSLLGTDVWVDVEKTQVETDDVAPTLRRPDGQEGFTFDEPRDEDFEDASEDGTGSMDEEDADGDGETDELPWPAATNEPRLVRLVLASVSDKLRPTLVAIREATGESTEVARGIYDRVKTGEEETLADVMREADAAAVLDKFHKAGCVARTEEVQKGEAL